MWKSGKSKRVLKINSCGEIVSHYRSAREAALKNYVSTGSVVNRCNGKIKKPFDANGCSFVWEVTDNGNKNPAQ